MKNFINDWWFFIMIAVIIFLIACIGAFNNDYLTDNYKATCDEKGGTPVYNGKYWECLK